MDLSEHAAAAPLVFEQASDGLDGDSASLTEDPSLSQLLDGTERPPGP